MKGVIIMNEWKDIDENMQERLIEWYNVREEDMDDDDRQRLAELYFNYNFQSWNCPECGTHVHYGTPDNWDNFQGVCQADYTSYPGNKVKYTQTYLTQMCDHCRMTK